MTDWTEHLTEDEKKRLDQIELERRALVSERRRIYERCYKRMNRDK